MSESLNVFALPRFKFDCGHFGEAAKEYSASVDALLDQLAEAGGEEYFGIYTQVIPSLHWSATTIYFVAMIERKFTEACSIVQSSLGLPLSVSDPQFTGKGVRRAKKYLRDYAGVDLQLTAEDWDHLTNLVRLRNILAHGGSYAKLKELEPYCFKTTAFVLTSTGVNATSKTAQHVIEHGSEILNRLGNSIFNILPEG